MLCSQRALVVFSRREVTELWEGRFQLRTTEGWDLKAELIFKEIAVPSERSQKRKRKGRGVPPFTCDVDVSEGGREGGWSSSSHGWLADGSSAFPSWSSSGSCSHHRRRR
ncbi:unnamed protein product [Musa banksii]